ncbi:bifunctional 5-dehydro-2-deoxygluconokinase/5-dehydro-2-deoxyphosphogluconate aldolase [Lacimicrobium alkaliphilum]|uniref:5-dehydro-2-deoxygluconokinase n=1 Tax=Lacimicrobium alkaliphilum TaxID=1526571 RepID=A0A0U2Z537_9ALTE|nr:5-dehydro-2-deoxygluconokinase [Lacimicrobium alkaliphilum]ALS97572.1 5-dehydro-2-deoxygluconokinase [Lacimicrobium alkaliphilum]
MSKTHKFDVICLGRAAVDLYGEQIGSRLEDVSSFKKSLGGSSCNIAYGTARLGLKSSMLTRVGNDHMGRFLTEELEKVGCDVSHVKSDHNRLTGLVLLSIKDKESFPLLFYRQDCADMALDTSDFDYDYIASGKALLITGTHFSTEHTKATSLKAIEYARRAGTKVILDIDYRPVLWGLTGLDAGENRFVSDDNVTQHLLEILPLFDLIVGTEEEIHIAGGSTDTITSLRTIRQITDAEIVVKRGALGCSVFDGEIPDNLDQGFTRYGVEIEVLNVLGAGDAFISGFLKGWLRDESYANCCDYANACGALVVSRLSCAPAIPTVEELNNYLSRKNEVMRPDLDEEITHLHRVTTRSPQHWDELCIFAFDHRKQLYDMAKENDADPARIPELKLLLLKAAESAANNPAFTYQPGVLIDDTYGQDALNHITGKGWWIGRPVELPSSRPLTLEGDASIGSRLVSWPTEHIVKCLVFFHPEDEAGLRLEQEKTIRALYRSCCASGHEFLLEIIPPADMASNEDNLVRVIERLYNLGIRPDWWKLPAPGKTAWEKISALVKNRAPHCRGVILLGLDAPLVDLEAAFRASAGFDLCKGFAVGRSIFSEPSRAWFRNEISDSELMQRVEDNYLQLVRSWHNRKSTEVA